MFLTLLQGTYFKPYQKPTNAKGNDLFQKVNQGQNRSGLALAKADIPILN